MIELTKEEREKRYKALRYQIEDTCYTADHYSDVAPFLCTAIEDLVDIVEAFDKRLCDVEADLRAQETLESEQRERG